jgi:hypothetical protein
MSLARVEVGAASVIFKTKGASEGSLRLGGPDRPPIPSRRDLSASQDERHVGGHRAPALVALGGDRAPGAVALAGQEADFRAPADRGCDPDADRADAPGADRVGRSADHAAGPPDGEPALAAAALTVLRAQEPEERDAAPVPAERPTGRAGRPTPTAAVVESQVPTLVSRRSSVKESLRLQKTVSGNPSSVATALFPSDRTTCTWSTSSQPFRSSRFPFSSSAAKTMRSSRAGRAKRRRVCTEDVAGPRSNWSRGRATRRCSSARPRSFARRSLAGFEDAASRRLDRRRTL